MQVENQIPADQIKLPFQSYRVRCLKSEPQTSSKGNRMFVQEWEVYDAKTFIQDGVTVNPNGVIIIHRTAFTPKTVDMVNAQRSACGLPSVKYDDFPNVRNEDYLGAEAAVIASSDSEEMKNEVTGEPIVNPNTGKPVIRWTKRVNQWLPRS